jgi:hypothetical protein
VKTATEAAIALCALKQNNVQSKDVLEEGEIKN